MLKQKVLFGASLLPSFSKKKRWGVWLFKNALKKGLLKSTVKEKQVLKKMCCNVGAIVLQNNKTPKVKVFVSHYS